jgi:hypothetical protein
MVKKRGYKKPELARFGLISELTTGGSGQSSEAASEECELRIYQKTNEQCND